MFVLITIFKLLFFLKIYKNVNLNYKFEHQHYSQTLTVWLTECIRYLGWLNIFQKTGVKLNFVRLVKKKSLVCKFLRCKSEYLVEFMNKLYIFYKI